MAKHSLQRLRHGASAMLSGIARVRNNPEVRKTYRFILLALFAVTVLLDLGASYAVWQLTESADNAAAWITWGLVLLRILGILVTLVVAPVVAITACNLLFPVFSEIPFLAGMRSFDEARGRRLEARPGLGNATAIANSLRRFASFVVVTLCCFVIGWIPVVGPIVAPPLQLYFAARTISWELLDPYFDRLEISWSDQKKVTRRFRWELLGMGLISAPLLALPFLGPLLFGLIQAGAARFVVDVFPNSDNATDLVS